jgi:hypothetical protein
MSELRPTQESSTVLVPVKLLRLVLCTQSRSEDSQTP